MDSMVGARKPQMFRDNWNYSESKMEQVKSILKENAMNIVQIEVASPEDDMKHSTDLKVKVTSGDIAVRVRRPYQNYRDLTIRAFNKGLKTEIHKLRDGYCDWYLYAWENQFGKLKEWMLININILRNSGLLDMNRPVKMNKDGATGFVSFSIRELEGINSVAAKCIGDSNE